MFPSRSKPAFKEGEPSRVDRVLLDPGDRFGVVASTHGDSLAYAEVEERLEALGVGTVFHTGDITGEAEDPDACVLRACAGPRRYAVQGNHDVLTVGEDHIYTYDELVTATAEASRERLSPEGRERLMNAPARIDTPYFTIVHESVSPPYYAQRGKRRRKAREWSVGSSADENTTAVCYGRLDRVHFIGSDHTAYIIHGRPMLKVLKPRPGDELVAPPRSVVSVPSVALSRDSDYDAGFVVGDVLPDGGLKLSFHSFKPRARTPMFPVCRDRSHGI